MKITQIQIPILHGAEDIVIMGLPEHGLALIFFTILRSIFRSSVFVDLWDRLQLIDKDHNCNLIKRLQ